ncbi:carboxypeptidase-like regulatory domain-containing protein [Pareuzebyella sediminis]|uniref:carboxypeptidase-like regulatory domain-containing protein n=1 Tax=Pareuzebyella sediminis TaxID=2607998 RepID=UPI0011ECAEAF|nr:carboxypeptidase-like regulatory domain-containing protein [Pareuzebyella sediminis]
MKTLVLSLFSLLVPFLLLSQQTIRVTGTVEQDNGEPLPGAVIRIVNTSIGTQTDFDGNYGLDNVPINGTIEVSYIGLTTKQKPVNNQKTINFKLEAPPSPPPPPPSSSTSEKHYWVGAKIGYNFVGETDENFFVGSASLKINMLSWKDTTTAQHSFGVLGNIGNYKFSKDTDSSEDVQKIAQSLNGISIGLGYTHDNGSILDIDNTNPEFDLKFRQFLQSGIRMTSFTDIGEENETVNLAQSVTTVGVELELFGFKRGGALSLSSGASLYLFDKDKYNQIFDEERKSIISIDFTLILPISKSIGFFTNGTFAKGASASYILGIVFRPDEEDD